MIEVHYGLVGTNHADHAVSQWSGIRTSDRRGHVRRFCGRLPRTGLTDTTDQITTLVTEHIIKRAERGICSAAALYLNVMQEFSAMRE
ncbi:MAG TPA: hypothetical protein VL048_13335 [Xanthobacteraceae bacterium]|nr:hypothetical protein [Xanthobacteraceae bacterium]